MRKDLPVLLDGIVDPDREHPVHHLVVADTLDLCEPPDAPLGDGADPEFPLGRDGAVHDRLAEVRRRRFEDLLKVVGECDVVKEEGGAGPEVVVVVERLIRDGALEFIGIGDEILHRRAGVGLPLPRVAGDGDVEAVCVLDRLGGKGHHEALRDRPVADMAPVEGVEYERERVAGLEDLHRSPVMLVQGWGGFFRHHLCLRRTGGFLLLPGLVHPPEFRPALGSSAAGVVVAPGKEGAV